jgi:hypothetical protein
VNKNYIILKRIPGLEDVDWNRMAQDTDQWWDVNEVLSLRT